MADSDRLKLAIWFIGKCESLEQAERTMRSAVAAMKELSPQ